MLQFNFILIYIIHKVPVLLKTTRILKGLKKIKILKKNIVKDVRNFFRLKKLKKINDAAIKGIRNPFRLKK